MEPLSPADLVVSYSWGMFHYANVFHQNQLFLRFKGNAKKVSLQVVQVSETRYASSVNWIFSLSDVHRLCNGLFNFIKLVAAVNNFDSNMIWNSTEKKWNYKNVLFLKPKVNWKYNSRIKLGACNSALENC